MLKGWTKLILGVMLMLLGGLATVGSVASGRTSTLLMTLPLLACAVALVAVGRGNIRTAAVKPTAADSSPWQDDTNASCPNCGACDLPDAEHCCQYCGSKLQ